MNIDNLIRFVELFVKTNKYKILCQHSTYKTQIYKQFQYIKIGVNKRSILIWKDDSGSILFIIDFKTQNIKNIIFFIDKIRHNCILDQKEEIQKNCNIVTSKWWDSDKHSEKFLEKLNNHVLELL